MNKNEFVRECKKYCKKYDTSYHVDLMDFLNEDIEKPFDKREVCKNCIYDDAEFMTGCNYPYITG